MTEKANGHRKEKTISSTARCKVCDMGTKHSLHFETELSFAIFRRNCSQLSCKTCFVNCTYMKGL